VARNRTISEKRIDIKEDKEASLKYLFFTFLKLGSISFGGFMALISVIQDQLVDKDKMIKNETVLDGISLASVLPGPIAVNVVTFIGYNLKGLSGAIVSMIAIVIPSFLLLCILSFVYFQFGSLPTFDKVFNGIMPAVCAIILAVAINISRKNIHDYKQILIAVASGLILLIIGGFLSTFIIILVGGLLGALLYHKKEYEDSTVVENRKALPSRRNIMRFLIPLLSVVVVVVVLIVVIPIFLPEEGFSTLKSMRSIALTFSGLSITLFGGGYVVIPAMHEIFVDTLKWLTSKEFADGIALGQVTPGPIYISAAFIGYKVHGFLGALIATVSVFLPAGLIMIICSKFLDFFKNSSLVKAVFKGLRPAVIGMIFSAAVTIGKGINLSWLTVLIFLSVLVLSVKFKVNVVYLIPASGIIGLLLL
jgi:chromate transporter